MLMQPIDMVYCWCDGNDPVFKARKNLYLRKEKKEYDKESTGSHRFVDNEEMKYSLRSLEMYAPWIRHVYIVTDRQVPKWLNCNNKRISIIDHSEIMPKDIIPCFNSVVIEKFLANIPRISEYFLYGNDDVFFGRTVSPKFFFRDDGKPIVYVKFFEKFKYIWGEEDFLRKYKGVSLWMKTNLNAWKLLYDRYHKNEFYVSAHTIDGYKKSLFQNTINRYKTMKNFVLLEDFGVQMRLQGRFLAWIWYTQVTLYYPLLKLLAFGKNTFIRKGDTLGSVIVVLKMKRRENKF